MPTKKDTSFSTAKKGMNKDVHISNLQEGEYAHAKNSNFFEEQGEGFNIQNEHSNILASKFKDGFKVVGFKNDVNLNETYYFLKNSSTGVSEIGRIKNISELPNLEDAIVDCDECNQQRELTTPLEDLEQQETQTYETLLNDFCEESDNRCLNFSLDYPIKTAVIKNEKCGKVLYWTDNLNPPRYLELDNLDQYSFTGNILCGEDFTEPACGIACDKLEIFKDSEFPIIVPTEIVLGGNLKRGTYQFVLAYCDEAGNEQSRYFSITEPIPIFDRQNKILEGEQVVGQTNYAIKLNVKNLDKSFTNYKVVVIQNTDINRATSFFEEGIHSTSDNTVIYTTEQNKIRTSLDKISQFAVRVDKLEQITTANNYLLGKGITYKKRLNLQKVVNLIGEFVQWQSHIATENLYKDGINASKYKSFNRDETYPLALRFIEDGEYSPTFPLVGRQAITTDLESVELIDGQPNKDHDSINKTGANCSTETLNKRWQLYNTATETGKFIEQEGIDYQTVEVTDQASCVVGDENNPLAELSSSNYELTISLDDVETYVDLQYYLEQNIEDILATDNSDLTATEIAIKNLFTLSNYENDNCQLGEADLGDICEECPPENPECEENQNCCEEVTAQDLEEEEIKVLDIVSESSEFIPASFPDEYPTPRPPSSCNMFGVNEVQYFNGSGSGYCAPTIYKQPFPQRNCSSPLRSETPFPSEPSFAEIITPTQDLQTLSTSFYVNYFFGFQESEMLSSKKATASLSNTDEILSGGEIESQWGTDFTYDNYIYNNARWFKLENFQDTFILNMSRDSIVSSDLLGTREYRICVYKNSSNNADPIYITLKSITESLKIKFKKSGNDLLITNNENPQKTITNGANDVYYVAIDTPYHIICDTCANTDDPMVENLYRYEDGTTDPIKPKYYNFASSGCFSLAVTDGKNKEVKVTFDNIKIAKEQIYNTTCDFQQPIIDDDCKVVPNAYGEFGYVESTEEYPDNKELYDSTTLKIKPADIPTEHRTKFELKFTDAGQTDAEGNYILKDTLDLRCNPIRHFKFPDNKVSSFIYDQKLANFSDSFIFPLGVKIDGEIVETALNIAVNNNLITEKQKNSIQGFELLRGDRTSEKSILGKGVVFDLYEYDKNNKKVNYANYPLNSLGVDNLHYKDSNRNDLIPHPNDSNSNYKWTFSSPETDYDKVNITPLMKVESEMYGSTLGNFDLVEDHSKHTILGRELKKTAGALALLEVIAEAVIQSMQAFSNINIETTAIGGTAFDGGYVAAPVIAAFNTISAVVFKYARYKYQWLETFRNLGKRRNFAAYYTTVGKFNYLNTTNIEEGDSLRYLNLRKNITKGRTIFTDNIEGERLELNHVDREDTVLLSTGKSFPINYSNVYKNYDNTQNQNKSSRTYAGQARANERGRTKNIERNTASLYVSLKNFLPSQYGTINSVRWIPTNKKGHFNEENFFFGGDTYICRHTLRRPFPFFLSTAFNQADMTPYDYKRYTNIGEEPRFYCNFLSDAEERNSGKLLPTKDSDYKFDLPTNTGGSYVKEPSKFYLWYNGIPSFLTESTINTNFRYAEPEPWNNFYPNIEDYMWWTQEKNNPARKGNKFLYNRDYSKEKTVTGVLTLPDIYNQEEYDCKTDSPNGVIYSLPDNSENNFNDPWLIFRPLDKYEFQTKYGKLNSIKGIESEQVLAIFDKTTAIFGAFDQLVDDGRRPETRQTGLGGMFAQRPRIFTDTSLGYAGSQHFPILSCEYGHFFVDSERGQVFKVETNGKGLQEISAQSNGEPSGMRNWFKEYLPFKIRKYFPNIDIDNPYNGFGITMGYDSRYKRIFITKKDFIPQDKNLFEEIDGVLYIQDERTKQQRKAIEADLINVSWTISYNLDTAKWASFFDFKPNYYIDHNNYFQTGKNTEDETFGLWSHLLTNKSFQVFYGKPYPWEIEVPVQNKGTNQVLESVSYRLDSRRYSNDYDFIQNKKIGFEEAYIYNSSNHSGLLKLDWQKTLRDLSKYPKTEGNKQRILQTQQDGISRFNYFYNRIKKESSQLPLFKNNKNGVDKQSNNNVLSFYGKRVLERLRGNAFLINLKSYETQHKKIFELAQFNKNLYTK